MDMIEFLGYIVLGYLIWQLLKSWIFVQQLKHQINDAIADAQTIAELEKHVLALRFEHVNENGHCVVLAYDKNNKFLSQGNTESEVEQYLQKKFPQHRLVIVNENMVVHRILDIKETSNGSNSN